MVKIAICEDNLLFAKKLSNKVHSYFRNREFDIQIEIYSKPEEISLININHFDLFLLDIEMGFINGIDLGINIKNSNPNATILYISAYQSYSIAGYKARPIAFILKSSKNMENNLNDALDEFVNEKLVTKESIILKNKFDEKSIYIEDIIYIESLSRKLIFHFIPNLSFEIYGKISEMEKKFIDKNFIRVHRSYLVNLKYIKKISSYKIYLIDGTILPASEHKYSFISQTYALWKGRN